MSDRIPVLPKHLRPWLKLSLLGFALLAANSLYLLAITLLEAATGRILENTAYLWLFLAHLLLGLALLIPFLRFVGGHLKRALQHPNRYAIGAGLTLLSAALLILVSGLALVRFEFWPDWLMLDDQQVRTTAYATHLIGAVVIVWAFLMHRLAGPPLRWRPARGLILILIGVVSVGIGWHLIKPDATTPGSAWKPALSQADPIPAKALMRDENCAQCHADIAAQHAESAHKFSSFNNPAYRMSVENTRKALMARSGEHTASRVCAGCHDPAPLFSGRFDRADFNADDSSASAGLTCLACHAVSAINSPKGNADYRLELPPAYPFDGAEGGLANWTNRMLIRAKPSLHKRSLLRPLHRTTDFCGSCHKVHLPKSLNGYRWLRGQNHRDGFLLSGVSGHAVNSFYYPAHAQANCHACHMPTTRGDDPAAIENKNGQRLIHDHRFATANTALAHWLNWSPATRDAQRAMLRKAARLDIFAIRQGESIDGPQQVLHGQPLVMKKGERYSIEVVIRNLGTGHPLTEGTADSNQLWLALTLNQGDRTIARSGELDERGQVDPNAYFVNALVLDAKGERIDRRNAEDIVVPLYNHQIPPGAASLVRYAYQADMEGTVQIQARLRYRKFDTRFLEHMHADLLITNTLPIIDMAEADSEQPAAIPLWQRWNDYGIALLRNPGNQTALTQAIRAFQQVERLGRVEGPINLARSHLKSGELDRAVAALQRAEQHPQLETPWVLTWLGAQIDRQRGHLEAGIGKLERLMATDYPDAKARGFDFSADYRARNLLVRSYYDLSRAHRSKGAQQQRDALLKQAETHAQIVLKQDPENLNTHHSLSLIYADLSDPLTADKHRQLAKQYKPDEQAAEQAVTTYRRTHPEADRAATPLALYPLQ